MTAEYVIRNDKVKNAVIRVISTLDPQSPWTVSIKPYKKSRSAAQNRLYWKWVDVVRLHVLDHTGVVASKDDVHAEVGGKFLPTVMGKDLRGRDKPRTKSTTQMTTAEFTDYLDSVEAYCAESLNLLLPHPEDLYYEAMGQ